MRCIQANITCSLVNTIPSGSRLSPRSRPRSYSVSRFVTPPQQKVLFQLRASRNLRSPMGSRPNPGGLPSGLGMTPWLSIHLPIAELLSSGQVVQNLSDNEASTASPLSSTTSTEPRFLWRRRSRSSYGIRMPYPAPVWLLGVLLDQPETFIVLLRASREGKHWSVMTVRSIDALLQ